MIAALGLESTTVAQLEQLRACLDAFNGRYTVLKPGAKDFGAYVRGRTSQAADEETLTEPILAAIIERVLRFPADQYFPQLGKSGLKPDFTPIDLIAHPFVLDAKGSNERFTRQHVAQVQTYVAQRSVRFGVLFNLREMRVYRRGSTEHEEGMSFPLLPLWDVARGEALPGPELEAFERFCRAFAYRRLSTADKIWHIRTQESWARRLSSGEDVTVDVEFLVTQLRLLAEVLVDDAASSYDELDRYLSASPGRTERLVHELEQLALDLEPGIDLQTLPEDVEQWRSGEDLPRRVWRQYLLRVTYLSLTRTLLYRAWEDVQFVDEALYDGGFDAYYTRMDERVRDVLRRAMTLGAERYRTLFLAENNYEWYVPSEVAIVEVLYRLGSIPLGRLDRDALGALYVSYVDEIDRDRLGQFFTPRDVVSFMLDRVGFRGPEGLFAVEGDERKPLHIFDFATGSGGFLVEAARRIIDDSMIHEADEKGLREALTAITSGFYGGEISPFPYYLTEINLLLQVSRLLGRLKVREIDPPRFVLGVLRTDSLATKTAADDSLAVSPDLRADTAELTESIYDVVPVEPEKQRIYREVKRDGTFDVVVGNPPYVGEANNKPLFKHLRAIPAWQGIYRGKTDYSYYFLWLAAEKLKPGGRLAIITPAAWMNAGVANFLREKLTTELTIDEIFLFGSYRLFAADQGPAPTPTVESAILIARKGPARTDHRVRVVVLESDETPVTRPRDELLEEMAARAVSRPRRSRGLLSHRVPQSELEPDYPWPVKWPSNGPHMNLVRHLKAALAASESPVEPLAMSWKVFTGIETAADAYTQRIRRKLPPAIRRAVEANGATVGEPIMELPRDYAERTPWNKHRDVLALSPEPTAILYGALDTDDAVYYLQLLRDSTPPQDVLDALERWKPLLGNRAEIRRNASRKWWETAWPRDPGELAAPKVIALYRTNRGRFALDESGTWKPGKKCTVVVGREPGSPVAYLCGLLNSELLDMWYAVRGKTPWHDRRNYEPLRMNEIPYRQPRGDGRVDFVASLVREVAENRLRLLPHRVSFLDLGRIIKDPWRIGPVELNRHAVVTTQLAAAELVSVRLDAELVTSGAPSGRARVIDRTTLVFRRGRVETGRITGDPARIELLSQMIGNAVLDDPLALVLPKDLSRLETLCTVLARTVTSLLEEGRAKVEIIERYVCSLYNVPETLCDEVIANAVERVRSAMPED